MFRIDYKYYEKVNMITILLQNRQITSSLIMFHFKCNAS